MSFGQREGLDIIVIVITQMEKKYETGLRERGSGKNVKSGEISS